MSEKILQLNEEIIRGQIKELACNNEVYKCEALGGSF